MEPLTALDMGFDPDNKFAEAVLYSVQGSYPVGNPLDIDPIEAVGRNPLLYKTTDHGVTWVPVARYIMKVGRYSLERL